MPAGNLRLYRRIYVLEQWLRRILMAALMSRYGTQWRSAIPTEVSKLLRSRREQLRTRTILDVESSDNVIWLLTLDELRRLLVSSDLWPSVKELIGLQKADLDARIEEMREIRNVVGHNRATTIRTGQIFDGIDDYLWRGIDHFREQTLYRAPNFVVAEDASDPLASAVQALWDGKRRQVALASTEKFHSVTFLPVAPFTLISVPDLLEAFHHARHTILAFYVNDRANEFAVIWPRGALLDEHRSVISGFESFCHFTETPYAEQDPKYICDPRIWFYSDELFAHEAEEA
jgi:hypothetical protein